MYIDEKLMFYRSYSLDTHEITETHSRMCLCGMWFVFARRVCVWAAFSRVHRFRPCSEKSLIWFFFFCVSTVLPIFGVNVCVLVHWCVCVSATQWTNCNWAHIGMCFKLIFVAANGMRRLRDEKNKTTTSSITNATTTKMVKMHVNEACPKSTRSQTDCIFISVVVLIILFSLSFRIKLQSIWTEFGILISIKCLRFRFFFRSVIEIKREPNRIPRAR